MNRNQPWWILPIVLWSMATWAAPNEMHTCGNRAGWTLEQRLKNCAAVGMRIVRIDDRGHIIKMDGSGLLWGDDLGYAKFDQAQQACSNVTAAQGYPSIPGVRGKWRLPTAREFARIGKKDQRAFNSFRQSVVQKEIQGNGTWTELPNVLGYAYWTSSASGSEGTWVFQGSIDGAPWGEVVGVHTFHPSFGVNVRCVARS